jgi:DNA-binding transcriptional MerR regulator
MKVIELARKNSITADSIRFYTREGLLTPRINQANGYKDYNLKDEARLNFILSARKLGFSIADIKQIIDVADKGTTPCPLVRELIAERLNETEIEFQTLVGLRERMAMALNDWETEPDKSPTADMICHLIEKFEDS